MTRGVGFGERCLRECADGKVCMTRVFGGGPCRHHRELPKLEVVPAVPAMPGREPCAVTSCGLSAVGGERYCRVHGLVLGAGE